MSYDNNSIDYNQDKFSERQNKLAQWAKFFDAQGLAQPTIYDGKPVLGVNNNQNRMNYAQEMLQQEDSENIADRRSGGLPNFYGQQGYSQPSLPQQQYVQPQMFQNDNPNSQYGSQNNQNSGVTNYLNTMMARRTQRG